MKTKAIVEISEGSTDKVEIKDGTATITKILSLKCPTNYGFIKDTLAEDGDALDVFIVSSNALITFDEVDLKLIGVFHCIDNGIIDNKVLAIVKKDPMTSTEIWNYMTDVGNYLMNYKGKEFQINRYQEFKSKKDMQLFINKYRKII